MYIDSEWFKGEVNLVPIPRVWHDNMNQVFMFLIVILYPQKGYTTFIEVCLPYLIMNLD